jgi:hypothetical protein
VECVYVEHIVVGSVMMFMCVKKKLMVLENVDF